jgi:hypothetical protein
MTFRNTGHGWKYFYCGVTVHGECTDVFRLEYCSAGMSSCSVCPINIEFNRPYKDDTSPSPDDILLDMVSGTFVLLMEEES